jgi:hypothetical protein
MRIRGAVIFICLSMLLACHSEEKKDIATLKVIFYDYQKDAFRVYMSDRDHNDYEETFDSVMMKVLSDGTWHDFTYLIQLSEYPVRTQFQTMNSEFTIAIDRPSLLTKDTTPGSPHISSGDIRFR